MPSCILSYTGCEKRLAQDGESKMSYLFPKDPALKRKWLRQIERKTVNENSRICHKHFAPWCFVPEAENVDCRGRQCGKFENQMLFFCLL